MSIRLALGLERLRTDRFHALLEEGAPETLNPQPWGFGNMVQGPGLEPKQSDPGSQRSLT